MDGVTIARAIHVIFVVLWVGGVAFVTTVLLPSIRGLKSPRERMQFFHHIERRFAWQARISTAVVGLSGLDMIYRLDLWARFRNGGYWWMHAMLAVWLIFTVMLFVAEPFVLDRWLLAQSQSRPEATFRLIEWLHRFLLVVSLVTILGAVAGSHGLRFFG
jgi:uncharacterized membrane protein